MLDGVLLNDLKKGLELPVRMLNFEGFARIIEKSEA
jgi:hypothetical protein